MFSRAARFDGTFSREMQIAVEIRMVLKQTARQTWKVTAVLTATLDVLVLRRMITVEGKDSRVLSRAMEGEKPSSQDSNPSNPSTRDHRVS